MMYGNTESLLLLGGDGENVIAFFFVCSSVRSKMCLVINNIEMRFDINKNG